MELSEEEKKEELLGMCLFDDVFFEVAAEDPKVCEEIIQTILNDDTIQVLNVIVQDEERVIGGRTIVVDALCELENGVLCNIEVQQANNINHVKRVRYHSSVITAKKSDPGIKFDKISTLYIIYISRDDIFHDGKTVYHVNSVVEETGKTIDDGLHRIFVNAEINDNSKTAQLMECFKTPDFENGNFPILTDKVRDMRYGEGGRKVMTKSEELIMRGKLEGKLEDQLEVYTRCIEEGMTKEMALKISGLPEDKIPADE